MKNIRLLIVLLPLLAVPFFSSAQYDPLLTERLGIFGPIQFQNKTFTLLRTSYTPDSATYNTYKQEYIAAGEGLDTFKTMIIINVFTGAYGLEDIANAKIDELRELQKTNPIVNWQTFNNKKTGEFMLDFLTTENSADGQYIDMAERTVYRYVVINAKSGQECGVLFGVITRSYGDDVDPFLATLKTKAKGDLIKAAGTFKIPDITIAAK